MILHNIELLKTDPNAFSFDQPTNMIILEVGDLDFGLPKGFLGRNVPFGPENTFFGQLGQMLTSQST